MSGYNNTSERWSTCPDCGKRGYTDRKVARRARKHNPAPQHLAVYRCPHNRTIFHLGHRPPALTDGTIGRKELDDRARGNA